jgi:PhnB protein
MAEQRVIPMLSYEDAGRAADWIARAFGAVETERWSNDDGRATHVNMELEGGVFMLGYPSPDYQGPKHHAEVCEHARKWSETPYIVDGVHVTVDDIDAHYERAKAAGARILSELEDNPGIGQRQYRAEDVEGHRWMFAQPSEG